MIVLDTNVVSEAMRPTPDPQVQAWLDGQSSETLYLSSVTVAELGYGVAAMPEGRRKQQLAGVLEGLLGLFRGRVLAFDTDAALRYAMLAALARASGRGFPTPDGYIAAIASSRGFIVASRDTAPYVAGGVSVVNPWAPGA